MIIYGYLFLKVGLFENQELFSRKSNFAVQKIGIFVGPLAPGFIMIWPCLPETEGHGLEQGYLLFGVAGRVKNFFTLRRGIMIKE